MLSRPDEPLFSKKAVLDDGAGAGAAGGAGGEIVSENACPVVPSHHVSTTKQQVPSGPLFGRALAVPPSTRVCRLVNDFRSFE